MTTPRTDPNYRHTDPSEELCGDYVLECQNCKVTRNVNEYTSVGWKVGDMVTPGGSDPNFGKCLKCKATGMLRVIKTPVLSSPTGPVGFTQIPKE